MIPQTKVSALIDKMNLLLRKKPSEFELAQINAEITKIENSGLYSDAQELKGILSAITGNVVSLKKHYEAALKSSGNHADLRLSYATSLTNAFQLKDAVEIVDKLVDIYSDDIRNLTTIFTIYSSAFNFSSANNIRQKLLKLGVDHENKLIDEKTTLNLLLENVLLNHDIKWYEICHRSEVVVDALKKSGLKVYPVYKLVDEDSITIEFPLDIELDELIEVDSLITDSISNLPYSKVDECVFFTCTTRNNIKQIAA